MWLLIPGTIVIGFPLLGLIVWTVVTKKDQFVHLRNLLESHYWLVFAAAAIALVPTMYAVYLTITDEARRVREADRTDRIYAKFAPDYRRNISLTEQIVGGAMIALAIGFVALLCHLHFFR